MGCAGSKDVAEKTSPSSRSSGGGASAKRSAALDAAEKVGKAASDKVLRERQNGAPSELSPRSRTAPSLNAPKVDPNMFRRPSDAVVIPTPESTPAAFGSGSSGSSGSRSGKRILLRKGRSSSSSTNFYPSNIWEHYEVMEGGLLGQGNFGIVLKVKERSTGDLFAMKCVSKVVLDEEQLKDLQREVDIMNKLGRSLNCVYLYATFEDDAHVYLVMEVCTGGSLFSRITAGDYTEKRVAEMVRASLQVCAQCHSKHIVYRDLKPQNFLLLSEDRASPLKATDFGLAVYLPPGSPPLRDTTGTPFYMAPEVIKKCYGMECDIWSAGVVTYQLLTGRLPFPGPKKSECKSGVERVIRSFQEITSKEVDFTSPPWPHISPGAKDLVQRMLDRDVRQRITAVQALDHPWLQPDGTAWDVPLGGSVVQRLQRFGTFGRFKQTLLSQISSHMFVPKDPNTDELRAILALFRKMDADKSGAVSLKELQSGLQKSHYQLSGPEAAQLLQSSDLDGTGDLDEREFMSALLDWSGVEQKGERWEQACKDVFVAIDKDGTGMIDTAEVAELLGVDEANSPEVTEAMREADLNGDGVICLSEFLALLKVGKLDSLSQYDRRLRVEGEAAGPRSPAFPGGGASKRWAGVAGSVMRADWSKRRKSMKRLSEGGAGGRLVGLVKEAVDHEDILVSSHRLADITM